MDISEQTRCSVESYGNQGDKCFEVVNLDYEATLTVGRGKVSSPLDVVEGMDIDVTAIKDEWVNRNGLGEVVKKYVYSTLDENLEGKSVQGASVFFVEKPKFRLPALFCKLLLLDIFVNRCPRSSSGKPIFLEVQPPEFSTPHVPSKTSSGFLPNERRALTESKGKTWFRCQSKLLGVYDLLRRGKMLFAPVLPYKSAIKAEVRKVDKKNRFIQVGSFFWHLFAINTIIPAFCSVRSFYHGNAIGIGFKGGGILRVFYFFALRLALLFDWSIGLAWDRLLAMNFLEADKKEWEGRTTRESGFFLLYHWCGLVKTDLPSADRQGFLRLTASYWADYIRPYITLGGSYFATREGATPSGNTLTADGNTWRHRYSQLAFYIAIKYHGFKKFNKGCPCGICGFLNDEEWIGQHCDRDELDVAMAAMMMSDDHISISTTLDECYVWFSDNILSFRTEYEVNRPTDTGGPLFLQQFVTSSGGVGRATERAVNKIYHGSDNAIVCLSSCVAMAYLSGSNTELYDLACDLARDIVDKLGTGEDMRDMVALIIRDKHGIEVVVGSDYLPTREEVRQYNDLNAREKRLLVNVMQAGIVNGKSALFEYE
nr:MAG: RNA-dependent RNA polymerase [Wufeng shrew ribovirus 6]